MPRIGYGVYQIPSMLTERCVADALSVGYRHIDTAQCYGNEVAVGRAVKRSGIPRNDLFITNKLWSDWGYRDTVASIDKSLERLGTHIDLLLIHEPTGDWKEIYRAMEDALQAGKLRAIGVANFLDETFVDLAENCSVMPAVDQIETHVFRQQRQMHDLLACYGTVHESWSPLACGEGGLFRNPTLRQIAAGYGKTVAQVVLRWLWQQNIPIIPKSTHKERMRENLDILDFALTDSDMQAIAALDRGKSLFNWW